MKIKDLMFYVSESKRDSFCEDSKLVTFTGINLHHAVDEIIHNTKKRLWIALAERESSQLDEYSSLHNIDSLDVEKAKKLLVYCNENNIWLLDSGNHNNKILRSIIHESSLLSLDATNRKIDEWQQALLSDKIKKEANDFIHSYAHGKCHLFALVAAEMSNCNISVYWDAEAEDGDGGYIHEDCLVHAFIKLNDREMVDINGISEIDDTLSEYPCNDGFFAEYSPKQFKSIIIKKGWETFEKGEVAKIKIYIKENMPFIDVDKNELSLSL